MTSTVTKITKLTLRSFNLTFKIIFYHSGDGIISFDEMCLVIKSCMEENGLWFSEDEINDLADIIFEEAQDETQSYGKTKSLNFIQLKKHLTKYPGLIENLSINVERWLLPAIEISKKQSMKMPNKLRWSHIRNNYVDVIFILMFLMINIGLLTQRAYYYYKLNSNVFYIIARASGMLSDNCSGKLLCYLFYHISLSCFFCRSVFELHKYIFNPNNAKKKHNIFKIKRIFINSTS